MSRTICLVMLVGAVWASSSLAQPIEGEWKLESYGPIGDAKAVIPGTEITIRFGDDSTLEGSGGCNAYSGSFDQGEEAFSVRNVGYTEMECGVPEGVMDQENEFLGSLIRVMDRRVAPDRLMLVYEAGEAALNFVNAGAVPASPEVLDLGIGEWKLVSFGPLGEEQPLIPGTEVTIFFGEDNAVRGSGGCNGYSGVYETADAGIFSIEHFGSTDMACSSPAGIMGQEIEFEDAVARITGINREGDRLTLFYNDGQGVLHFVAAETAVELSLEEWLVRPSATDLNDDGRVDEADYELSKRGPVATAVSSQSWGAVKKGLQR